jgi:hypothetical protein
VADFCPHCHGSLRSAPTLLQHPCFNDAERCIVVGKSRRHCTRNQWNLLTALRQRPGQLVAVDFLAMKSALHPEEGGSDGSARYHVCRLRRKMDGAPFTIVNEWGGHYGLFPSNQTTVTKRSDKRKFVRTNQERRHQPTVTSDM